MHSIEASARATREKHLNKAVSHYTRAWLRHGCTHEKIEKYLLNVKEHIIKSFPKEETTNTKEFLAHHQSLIDLVTLIVGESYARTSIRRTRALKRRTNYALTQQSLESSLFSAIL